MTSKKEVVNKVNIDMPLATRLSCEDWISSVSYKDDFDIKDGEIEKLERIIWVWPDTQYSIIESYDEYEEFMYVVEESPCFKDKTYKFRKDLDGSSINLVYEDGNNRLYIISHFSSRMEDDVKAEMLSKISGCNMVKKLTKYTPAVSETWVCDRK